MGHTVHLCAGEDAGILAGCLTVQAFQGVRNIRMAEAAACMGGVLTIERHGLFFPVSSTYLSYRITSYNVCYTKLLRLVGTIILDLVAILVAVLLVIRFDRHGRLHDRNNFV